ncbi:molybdopterin-dependent oxidoreductase [Anabaena cylindrica FACHB-243]|uniref:Oxidoreductase molybdopterin binding protein n=1 Tax=Anabaena cylindrica (strain ATCC 27899 / PCC 7122) TaxID=272123 RepID=K9ZDL1_ANACC|nr:MULTISPECIES: molybdopterin-dependent oxidoreductase [Anabaena]AFZ57298.1 oxidoreductase molybdopterin binding protein [Anabaena cylindrica PCC 7122]MBD2420967.1 molybdopterin-dependent oxidoreductase [Anabaena cylindrica FACHB-243]MBY5283432.1 molybdopterin-dependent oxidoreductase [Anabaena sp. CCAP 1446/1C]MBY5310878.1 molybdopterin-dependent oxidoreductase [Anabaena sp. CCAP 1446/1C]MCM2405720.1 molybdopterin-dependent oxidoreductase [Anabaena sp. CCAP 1446/1C]
MNSDKNKDLIHLIQPQLTRRKFLQISGISSMSLFLGSCGTPAFEDLVGKLSEPLNQKVEELIFQPQKLVPEFSANLIEPEALIINSFRNTPIIDQDKFRLIIDGDVNHPLSLSMAEIQALPLTSMIIRHVCVEGWAAIVQWGGIRLRDIIALAQPQANVKYAFFESADGYYESWDIASATHPQTLLAYQKNGEKLPVENGAPLRLASPIKLGYKQSKWVTRITLTRYLSAFKGYWEDQGYEWFAGL